MINLRLRGLPRSLATFLALPLFAASCQSVEFYEKGAFADPTMEFAETPAQLHWLQKVQYSDEGAAGGIGTSAGGGCGCY